MNETHALLARVEALERRVQQLEAGRRCRDAEETALLEHLGRLGATFTAREVFRHTTVDEALAGHLLRADIDSPRSLGNVLDRVEHAVDGPVRVSRVDHGRRRDGIRWRVSLRV